MKISKLITLLILPLLSFASLAEEYKDRKVEIKTEINNMNKGNIYLTKLHSKHIENKSSVESFLYIVHFESNGETFLMFNTAKGKDLLKNVNMKIESQEEIFDILLNEDRELGNFITSLNHDDKFDYMKVIEDFIYETNI